MKKPITHPYDRLFKTSLQYPEVACEFLEMFLPEDIKRQLDFNSITYCQINFLDEQLNLSQADVLFECKIAKQDAYLYILAEQESEVDALIAFWLMKYMVAIWDWHIKKCGQGNVLPLPPIFPLVFYTGDKRYTACRHLWELFGEHSERMKTILQSPFHLIEANKIPEATLTSHVYAGTMGFILRKYFRKHIVAELRKIVDNLNKLEAGGSNRFVVDLLYYLLNVDEGHKNKDELINIIHDKMSPNLEKTMSSLAEKLIAEGERRGEMRGALKNKLETAKEMLLENADLAFIIRVTKLSLEQIRQLQKEITV
jgi:predicted transposase/invertase (TIGR01784 family)